MNAQDRFWNILKDDWTGRIYKTGDAPWYEFQIVEDRGEDLIYRQKRSRDGLRSMKRRYIQNKIDSGQMIRVK